MDRKVNAGVRPAVACKPAGSPQDINPTCGWLRRMPHSLNDLDEADVKAEIDEIMRCVDSVMKRIEAVLPSPQNDPPEPVEP
ncbi:MAG: hypothetical protein MUC46_06475 [Desulfobacterales bacterium]|nr:hypothetical protein [Desulfobacterales bacterium]